MKRNSILILLGVSVTLASCFKKFDPDTYRPPLDIGGFSSAREIAPANLVAYFAFNGSLIDSVSGTSGTNVGTTFSNGVKGQAMQGADESYVLFNPGPSILGMNSFTISYWVNSPVNSDGIVGLVNLANTGNFWGNIDMFFENGSTATAAKFRAHIQNGAKDSWIAKDGIPGVFGTWTNFTLSYDAGTSTFKFYINGALQVTQPVANFGPINWTNSGQIVFGTVHFQTNPSQTAATGSQSWASYLTGQLDEIRIYNKALTDAEVSSLVKLEGRGK